MGKSLWRLMMKRITELEQEMLKELKKVKGYEEHHFYEISERSGKIIMGRHIEAGMSTNRNSKAVKDQLVKIFRKYYHRRCEVIRSTGTRYQWNERVNSAITIIY